MALLVLNSKQQYNKYAQSNLTSLYEHIGFFSKKKVFFVYSAIIPQGFTFANIGHLNPSDLLQATMAHNLEEVTIMSIGQSDGHLPSNGQSDGHSAKLHGNSVFQKHHYKEVQIVYLIIIPD